MSYENKFEKFLTGMFTLVYPVLLLNILNEPMIWWEIILHAFLTIWWLSIVYEVSQKI